MTNRRHRWCTLVAAAALVLGACGGGGGASGGGGGGTKLVVLTVDLSYSGRLEMLHASTLTPVLTGFQSFTPQCALQGGTLPPGLSLRGDCTITGTPTLLGTYQPTIRISAAGVQNTLDLTFKLPVFGPSNAYALPDPFITGAPVDASPMATGWTRLPSDAFRYTVVGTLPPGLALDTATGRLSGTPTQTGTWPFRIEATLSNAAGTMTLAPQSSTGVVQQEGLTYATDGRAYAAIPFSVAPVIAPKSGLWVFSADVLPPGLALDPDTGVISGTPTVVQAGPATTTVTATQVGTSFQLRVSIPFQVDSPLLVQYASRTVNVGQQVGYLPTLTQVRPLGNAVITFHDPGGSLPPGVLVFDNSGMIVGIPTATATPQPIEVRVTANGVTFSTFTSSNLVVNP